MTNQKRLSDWYSMPVMSELVPEAIGVQMSAWAGAAIASATIVSAPARSVRVMPRSSCSAGPGASARGRQADGAYPLRSFARRKDAWAAQYPHMPWTPPPGGVEDEHR